MSLATLLEKNRSFRGFLQTPRPTEDELLRLVALTRLCPSSGNLQPLKYRLVCDAATCAQLLALTRWAGRMKEPRLPHEGMAPTAYIVILNDASIAPSAVAFYKDVGIAAHTLLLGAVEMGYGGCMIGGFSAAQISLALSLPPQLQPMLLVALGVPAEEIVLHDAPVGLVDKEHCYWRDENDVHHVWKRTLAEIVVSETRCEP